MYLLNNQRFGRAVALVTLTHTVSRSSNPRFEKLAAGT